VDPDGTDSAPRGAWARGPARQTDLRQYGAPDVIFQPGSDSPDDGSIACFTDSGDDALTPNDIGTSDVDDGVTTVQLPPFPLDGTRDPTLRFLTWHTAIIVDLENGALHEAVGDDLVTLASIDNGPWIEIDRDASNVFSWRERSVRLRDVPGLFSDGAATLRLRFVVGDGGDEQNVVEAGVDDVQLTDVSPLCVQGGSSSSSSSSATSSSSSSSGGSAPDAGTTIPPEVPPQVPPGCACTGPDAPADVTLLFAGLLALRRRR
jgi:uncharacterized protein (TIGR03382 family)